MVQAVDVLVLLHGPVLGDVCHSDLLALVDKRGAGLESEEDGDELGAGGAVLGTVVGEPADRAGLVVVLEVERIPAVVVVHESLPLVRGLLELGELPVLGGEFPPWPVIDVHPGAQS